MIPASIRFLAQQTQPSSPSDDQPQALASLLYYLLILVAVFLFGSYAILRASRRFRDSVTAEPLGPTPTPDIWSMSKLPADSDGRDSPEPKGDPPPNAGDEDNG